MFLNYNGKENPIRKARKRKQARRDHEPLQNVQPHGGKRQTLITKYALSKNINSSETNYANNTPCRVFNHNSVQGTQLFPPPSGENRRGLSLISNQIESAEEIIEKGSPAKRKYDRPLGTSEINQDITDDKDNSELSVPDEQIVQPANKSSCFPLTTICEVSNPHDSDQATWWQQAEVDVQSKDGNNIETITLNP